MVLGISKLKRHSNLQESPAVDRETCQQVISMSNRVYEWSDIRQQISLLPALRHKVLIHVIRHAESEINAKNLVTGSQDAKLTARGKSQAKRLGKKLDLDYDIAFTSRLKRAKNTLELAIDSGHIDISKKVVEDARLNERSLGILEGKKHQIIQEYAAGDLDYAPRNGETYREVSKRILSFLCDLSVYIEENNVRKVLICSHMGPMRILAGVLDNKADPIEVLGFHFSNADIWQTEWERLDYPKFLAQD